MLMAKLIKGYYINGVWHEYGGKLYDTIGYNTNGSMTQKAITDTLGSVMEVVSGYSMVVRVHGDASCSNLAPFYFVVDGDAFTMTITYNQPAIALNLSIIMGNTDITQEAYQDGIISIPRVTGNVVITVETASVTDETMFTKRTTANGLQVLNNKALLKSIKGTSQLLVQRLANPDFSNGQTSWAGRSGYQWTISVTDGILSIKAPSNNQPYLVQESAFNAAHSYLCMARIRVTGGASGGNFYFRNANTTWLAGVASALNTWYVFSAIATFSSAPSSGGNQWFSLWYNKNGATLEVDWAQCIDLTYLAGNDRSYINNYDSFHKCFPLILPQRTSSDLFNTIMTNYVSKDSEETTLQNVALDVTQLTGKLNGEGESVVIFPDGMKSSCNDVTNDTCDEIKLDDDGVWKAYKRIGTNRASNSKSKRYEYEILAEEEVYVLDDQTIPTEITVADQGVEEILPTNEATPTTAAAIMEIQYGSIPPNNLLGGGLLGGLLGGTKGGGSDEPDYSDGEEITDYKEDEEPEKFDEPTKEPLEDETEDEPKGDIKETPIIDEKQELKK